MIIGITGTDGAGKGAVVEYFKEKKGFVHYSSRALLEKEFARRGIKSNRANMRLVANELRAAHGNDFMVSSYLQTMATEGTTHAIIESIRAVDEVRTLKQNGGMLLAVDAKQSIRYNRIKGRNSSSDKVSLSTSMLQLAHFVASQLLCLCMFIKSVLLASLSIATKVFNGSFINSPQV